MFSVPYSGRFTRIATRLGHAVGYLFILGGILTIFLRPFTMSWFDGIWFVFIGLFLVNAVLASDRRIRWEEEAYGPAIRDALSSGNLEAPTDT